MVAATADGAEALRMPDVGRIAPGMRADLVLYDADPSRGSDGVPATRAVWKTARASGSEAMLPDPRLDAPSADPLVTVALIAANVIAFLFWQPTLRHEVDAELAQQTFFWCHGRIRDELAHQVPLARGAVRTGAIGDR